MTESTESEPKKSDDLDAVKQELFDMLFGDHFWHGRIRRILSDAGFVTRRIEREEAHPVWIVWPTRASFALDADTMIAARQIRRVLSKGGLKIARDEFNICYRRGDRLHCAFVLELGAPGVA